MFDFPLSPATGDEFTASLGMVYKWNGYGWRLKSAYVLKTGDTMSGDLAIVKASPTLTLDKQGAAQGSVIAGKNAGLLRWTLILGDSTAEAGSNAGSDAILVRYSDAGSPLDAPLRFSRANGLGTVISDPVDPLGIATKQYVDAHSGGGPGGEGFLPLTGGQLSGDLSIVKASGTSTMKVEATDASLDLKAKTNVGIARIRGYTDNLTRWVMKLGDETQETGSNVGSDFTLNGYEDTGVSSTPEPSLRFKRATGLGTVAGNPTDPLGIATKDYVDSKSGIPTNTTMLFYQAAAPVGWTKITTHNDKALRVVAGTGGVAGGSNGFSTVLINQNTTGGHTLASSEGAYGMATAGNQNIIVYPGGSPALYAASSDGSWIGSPLLRTTSGPNLFAESGSGRPISGQNSLMGNNTINTNVTGGGGSHTHPVTTNIAYCDVIIAKKD